SARPPPRPRPHGPPPIPRLRRAPPTLASPSPSRATSAARARRPPARARSSAPPSIAPTRPPSRSRSRPPRVGTAPSRSSARACRTPASPRSASTPSDPTMILQTLFDPLSLAVLVVVAAMVTTSLAWFRAAQQQADVLDGGLQVLRRVGRQLAPDHPIRRRLESAPVVD